MCVCRLSLSKLLVFFFQGLSFPHPLWPSERGERVQGTFWHSSTASRLTCAAKKEAHTKKRDFEGAFFLFFSPIEKEEENKTVKRLSAGLEYFVDYIITSSLFRMENHIFFCDDEKSVWNVIFFFLCKKRKKLM